MEFTNGNGKNEYKVDWNIYSAEYNPFSLYGRKPPEWWHRVFPWSHRWEHIASFKTLEEAKAHYAYLVGLPILLKGDDHG